MICDKCSKKIKAGYWIHYEILVGELKHKTQWWEHLESCDSLYLCDKCKPKIEKKLMELFK